ncbi:MAG: ribosomal protein methylthiotransferase accessory factor [Gaiellaceae bacterium]|nr:ribosomal protein methylthiotransferase accessory factor [Gaiellaceae bacterium]
MTRSAGAWEVDQYQYRLIGPTVLGSGTAFVHNSMTTKDSSLAQTRAIAESVERTASTTSAGLEIVYAARRDLNGEALDIAEVPQCSALEYAHPNCPLAPVTDSHRLHWCRAAELTTSADCLVPLAMVVGMRPADEVPFWLPISTGCAAHVDRESALINAILEVFERDAVALTWEQMLPLPLLDEQCLSPAVNDLIAWRRERFIDTHVFDATTDAGVPTVYVVSAAPEGAGLLHDVACAAALTPRDAADRAVREAMVGYGFEIREDPKPLTEFETLSDGTLYSGRREASAAFDFLLDRRSIPTKALPRPISEGADTAADALADLVELLQKNRLAAYAVDLSTTESSYFGLCVWKVIIPRLQPFSPRPLARFRGHARLYSAPSRMGYEVHPETRLNPYPQPFT